MRSSLWLTAGLVVSMAVAAVPADAGAPGARARLLRVGSCGPGGPQCQWDCNAPDPQALPRCEGEVRCELDATHAFVGQLLVEVDEAACAPGAGGARVKTGLRGRRADGSEFTIPDRTFDLCGANVACGPCDTVLCPEGGTTCPRDLVYLCDAVRDDVAFLTEASLPLWENWLGSPGGDEPGQLFPPDVEEDLRAAFPDATGRPVIVSAEEIASEPRNGASVRRFCVKAWFTRTAYDILVPDLRGVPGPASVTELDCTGPCGDGRLDPGESCDDGNTDRLDGCDERCRDLCAAPRPDCHRPAFPFRNRLVVEDGGPGRRSGVHWTWAGGVTTPEADFGDPRSGGDVAFCVYDESGPAPRPLMAAVAAGGEGCGAPPCWRAVGRRGFEYEDRHGSPHGVTRVSFRAEGTAGARIALEGAGPHLLLPDLPLPVPLRVQLEVEDGPCWEASYTGAARAGNGPGRFEAVDGR